MSKSQTAKSTTTPESTFSRSTAALTTPSAPKPNGNYSHVVRSGNNLHLCGLVGDDPTTGKIIHQKTEGQTKQIMRNISACLEAAGSNLDKIVSRRVYLLDMNDFRAVDRIWGELVKAPHPVSTCVGVTALSKEGAKIEIEVIAEA